MAAYVFLPTRLHVVNPCITITGIIKGIHVENDGDTHIRLLPDNSSLISQANTKFENGDLVLEAICQNPVSRPEVGSACNNFNHPHSLHSTRWQSRRSYRLVRLGHAK